MKMTNLINPNMYPNEFNQLPMLDQNLSNLLRGFSNFQMAHRGGQGGVLVANLTKNLIFQPFGPPEWSSTPSFGFLTGFLCWDRFSQTSPTSFGY